MKNDTTEFSKCMTVFILNAINEKQFENSPYEDIDYIKNKISLQYKMNDLSFVEPLLNEMLSQGFLCVVPKEPQSCYQFTDSGIKYYERERRDWQYINTVLANYSFSQKTSPSLSSPSGMTFTPGNNHAYEMLFSSEPVDSKVENPIEMCVPCLENTDGRTTNPLPPKTEEKEETEETDFLTDETLDEKEREILSEYMQRLKTKLNYEDHNIYRYSQEHIPSVPMFYAHKNVFLAILASFLWINLLSLILYYFKDIFDYSLLFLYGIAGVSGTVTLFSFFIYLANVKKKYKKTVPCKLVLCITIILFLLVTMISMGIYLLLYNGYSLLDWEIYIPSVFATTLPFGGIMFVLLYKSGRMTVKE